MGNRNRHSAVPLPVAPLVSPFWMNIFLKDDNNLLLEGTAEISIRCDNGIELQATKEGGFYHASIPTSIPVGWGGHILVKVEGYASIETRIRFGNPGKENPEEYTRDTQYINLFPQREYPFADERGWLSRDGSYIFTQAGEVWQYRGASQFLLFRRFKNGEDIRPNLVWLRKNGFNTARVLGPVDWQGCEDYFDLSNDDFVILDRFFTVLEQYGLRCEWVPITTKVNSNSHKWLLLKSYEVAKNHWNVLIEVANEPLKDGKCDPVVLLAGISTERVLTAYGTYVGGDGVPWVENKVKDYITYHSPRDYPKLARNSKDLLEMKDALHCPVFGDEPIGVAEKDEPGKRTTNIDAIVEHFAIGYLYSAGMCYHFQAGLEGRIPNENEPIQEACANHLCALFEFIPPICQTGKYSNPGGGGAPFPVKWQNADSAVNHAYASILGVEAYMVNPRPAEHWEPIGINGWKVLSKLGQSVVHLIKE